jgi:hypothetical protein
MRNTNPRANLHGLALWARLTNVLTTFATKAALMCALAIPTILNRFTVAFLLVSMGGFVCVMPAQAGSKHHHYKLVDLGATRTNHS